MAHFRNGFLVARKRPRVREEVLGWVNVIVSLTQGTTRVAWERDCQAWGNKGEEEKRRMHRFLA